MGIETLGNPFAGKVSRANVDLFSKAVKAVNTTGHWLIASPNKDQKPSDIKLVAWFQNMFQQVKASVTGKEYQSYTEPGMVTRSFTVAYRVAIAIGLGIALTGVGYSYGMGVEWLGEKFKAWHLEAKLVKDSWQEKTATWFQWSLETTGHYSKVASEKIFLSLSVPTYGVVFVLPKWIYTDGLPKAQWLGEKVIELGQAAAQPVMPILNDWVLTPITSRLEPILKETTTTFDGIAETIANIFPFK